MEAVLALTIPMDKKQFRPFLRVSRMWTRDENEDKWGVVVHSKLRNEVIKSIKCFEGQTFFRIWRRSKEVF